MRKMWFRLSSLSFLATICCWSGSVKAQTPEDYWSKIRIADVQIDASEVTWKLIHTEQPHATMAADKYIALSVKEWQQQGKSEKEIEQLTEFARQILLQSQQGQQITTLLALVHQGNTTRAEVTQGFPYPLSAPAKPWVPIAVHINFYDGKNSVELYQEQPQAGVLDGKAWFYGSLKRDTKEIMPEVGMGIVPFLVGIPLFTDYTPANSTLQDGADGTVVLDKHFKFHWGPQEVPMLTHWVISKQTWRPLLKEERFDIAATKDYAGNQNVHRRVRFLDYHEYAGASWWPSEILEEQLSGRGPDEKPGTTYDYQLQKAKFNGDADLSLLQKPLPVGAQIGDHRFGPDKPLGYVSKGNILTDAEALVLLQQQDGEPLPRQRTTFDRP